MPSLLNNVRVAVVADWITDLGGAERVTRDILDAFGQADLVTSVYFPRKNDFFAERKIVTSFLQRVPFFGPRHKFVPFLRRHAFEMIDLRAYDLVISSSSAESKGVITRPDALHICFCHTPTRYLWSHAAEYLRVPGFGWLDFLARPLARAWAHKARLWDWAAAQRVDIFLANSKATAARIAKYYGRTSCVIHPGIDLTQFTVGREKEDAYVALGRVVPYKRFDLLVDAFNGTGRRLTIVAGTKTKLAMKLVARSDDNIEWIFGASDEEVRHIMTRARGLVFPQEEDFGIVPLEAMACGTPVIAFARGGALETVKSEISGQFFDEQSPEALRHALTQFESRRWDPFSVRQSIQNFDATVFRRQIREACEHAWLARAV